MKTYIVTRRYLTEETFEVRADSGPAAIEFAQGGEEESARTSVRLLETKIVGAGGFSKGNHWTAKETPNAQ